MASLEYSSDNLTEAIRRLEKADLFTDENVKDLLKTGVGIMLASVKSAYIQAGHNNPGRPRRTGETYRHISRSRRVKKDKDGVPYMQVEVHGKDKRGQRYGTKAFVLNYGRRVGGQIPAQYYWNNAVKQTWSQVNAAMSDLAAEKLKGV